jgi:hypothetical protein
MKIGHAVLVLALFVCMEPAFALRCGNRLVSEGDHQLKVEKQCGQPAAVAYRTIYRSGIPASRHRITRHSVNDATFSDELLIHDRSLIEVQIEEWTYNFGPRRLMRVIRFENGIVTRVTTLGHGYIE